VFPPPTILSIIPGSATRRERPLLHQAGPLHAEDVGLTTAAEPVLRHLEDALTVGLALLLLVDVELSAHVDRMEDGLLAGEVAALGHLTDEADDAVGGLGPVGQHLRGADRCHGVGCTVPLAVVQRLKGVLQDEDLLALVGLADGIGVTEEVLDQGVLTDDEAVAKLEALGNHLDLVERLLARVVEADMPGARDGVGQLEEHRRLAGTRRTGQHHDRGGHHALATDGVVEPLDADLLAVAKGLGHLDVVDVGALLQTLDADGEVHLAHVRGTFRGGG